jgi:hypothetical protein
MSVTNQIFLSSAGDAIALRTTVRTCSSATAGSIAGADQPRSRDFRRLTMPKRPSPLKNNGKAAGSGTGAVAVSPDTVKVRDEKFPARRIVVSNPAPPT